MWSGQFVVDINSQVLKGESSQVDHTVTNRIDQTEFIETEVTRDEESELSSTSRFEMSKESAVTIKEDQSLKGDLKISASYGPFVEVAASVEGSTSRSKDESTKAASKVHIAPSPKLSHFPTSETNPAFGSSLRMLPKRRSKNCWSGL